MKTNINDKQKLGIMFQLEKDMKQKYSEMEAAIKTSDRDNVLLHRGRAEGVARALQVIRRSFE